MHIPKRPYISHEGGYKSLTKNCRDNCEWYRNIIDKEIYGWGVAFKYLGDTEKPRKCEIKNRKLNHQSAVEYINRYIKSQRLVSLKSWAF